MIKDALSSGGWVFLQNCHLSISWMPDLEKIVERFCNAKEGETGNPHPKFRLWLSSKPHPKFPITILQRGLKMTTEPPRGLRANMVRLYNIVDPADFRKRAARAPGNSYRRLLFSLCWFHSILLERRKFKSLGWNIPYGFNNADFAICHDILDQYLTRYPERTPWEALRYLIAEANYGGRITDDLDRRLAIVYINQYFNQEVLDAPNYRLAPAAPEYHTPDDGNYDEYKQFISKLPPNDPPAAFGQHSNADIQSAREDTRDMLSTLLGLQPRAVNTGGMSDEDRVLELAKDIERQLPATIDVEWAHAQLSSRTDPAPLKVVLYQEIDRYNGLLRRMQSTLRGLQQGIQGLVVITEELEQVFAALLNGVVPDAWAFCYPSLKPLGPWTSDLMRRVDQIRSWAGEQMPVVFWLSGFTYPTSFFTALLQTHARAHTVAINQLDFEYVVSGSNETSDDEIGMAGAGGGGSAGDGELQRPETGALLSGMYLEGARWDHDEGALEEPDPMELVCPMPMIHFRPIEFKPGQQLRASSTEYECPLYLYPVRTGTRERPSFMRLVKLQSGEQPPDFWVKRGTALLLSLAT